MVEGGGKVLTSFLRASLVDYAVGDGGSRLLGGMSALGELERTKLPRLDSSACTAWLTTGSLQGPSLGRGVIAALTFTGPAAWS